LRVFFHEAKGAALVLDIKVPFHRESQLFCLSGLFAFASVQHMRDRVASRDIPGIRIPQRLIIGMRRSIPLVEAVVGGPATVTIADVPLTHAHGREAGVREDIAQGALPGDDAGFRAGQGDGVIAGADGKTAGEQRGPRRRALRLGRIVEQFKTLASELVNAPGFRAAQNTSTIAAQFAVAKVVYVKIHNIGALCFSHLTFPFFCDN
jgi:hypothetical protein